MRTIFLASLLFMQQAFAFTPQTSNENVVLKKSVQKAIGGLKEVKSSGSPKKDCPEAKPAPSAAKSTEALPTLSSAVSKIVSEFKCDFGVSVEACLKLIKNKLSPAQFKELQNYSRAYLKTLPKESIEKLQKIKLSTKYGDAINQSAFLTSSSSSLEAVVLVGVTFVLFLAITPLNPAVCRMGENRDQCPTWDDSSIDRERAEQAQSNVTHRREQDQVDREAGFTPGDAVIKDFNGACHRASGYAIIADRHCGGIDYDHTNTPLPDQDPSISPASDEELCKHFCWTGNDSSIKACKKECTKKFNPSH